MPLSLHIPSNRCDTSCAGFAQPRINVASRPLPLTRDGNAWVMRHETQHSTRPHRGGEF